MLHTREGSDVNNTAEQPSLQDEPVPPTQQDHFHDVGRPGFQENAKGPEMYVQDEDSSSIDEVAEERQVELQRRDETCCDKLSAVVATVIPAGSIVATIFSMCATAIGGGILGVPSAFANSGAVPGVLWLVGIALAGMYSLHLLALAAQTTGESSYERLATVLLGRGGRYFVAGMRLVNCVGSMIAYVMTIGNLIKPILEGANAPDFLLSGSGFKLVQSGLWLCFFFPLTFARKVNQLRYVCTAGVSFMVFFSFCVMAHFAQYGMGTDVQMFVGGNNGLEGMGSFIFAYVCQVNMIELYSEMRRRSVFRFTLCAVISMSLLCTLYTLTGLFGYLEFGGEIGSSVLLMYKPLEEPQMLVSYIGVFVKLCASYGLFGNASRGAVLQALGWDPLTVALWKHCLFTIAITLFTLLLGLFVPNVNTVFHFVGGLCGGFLSFILPALFYMYAGNWKYSTVGIFHFVCTYLLLFMGVVAVVFGTAVTIFDFVG